MKLSATILILLLVSCLGMAQSIDGPAWTTFSSADEPFTVETPAALTVRAFHNPKRSDQHDVRYSLTYGGTRYFIFSEKAGDANLVPIGLKYLQGYKDGERITIGGHSGLGFAFNYDGSAHSAVYIKIDDHHYLFHALGRLDDPDIHRFLASIKFGSDAIRVPAAQTGVPSAATIHVPDKVTTTQASGGGIGSGGGSAGMGVGNGRGVGNGVGGGSGRAGIPSVDKAAVKPLTITTKPRPAYTEVARRYEVMGTVTLRITFLANGEVGSVSAVSGLPFGLTKAAIDAARQIKFEPQAKDGVPVSVTKTLQYTFTIY